MAVTSRLVCAVQAEQCKFHGTNLTSMVYTSLSETDKIMEKLIELMKQHEKKLNTLLRLDLFSDGSGRIDKNNMGFSERYIEFESIKDLMNKMRE